MFVTKYACTDNRTHYYIQRGFFLLLLSQQQKERHEMILENVFMALMKSAQKIISTSDIGMIQNPKTSA